jgi:hypothetical protein
MTGTTTTTNSTLLSNVTSTPSISELSHIADSSHETHNEHALFIRALLMLTMILLTMNINGFLHKKKFHYLSESAVTILLGEFLPFFFFFFLNLAAPVASFVCLAVCHRMRVEGYFKDIISTRTHAPLVTTY